MRNQKGFTLIEIIAVLVILGILAAVAVPRYLDLAQDAKAQAAQAQVAEMKSTLNLAYARIFIRTGSAPTTGAAVITEAGFTDGTPANVGTAPDIWNVTLTGAGAAVAVSINNRNGDTDYSATGTWNIPS
ncbi:MAG TPA: type II secretion system protein [Smithellaceae bacterium]|nr:type II secretion system protein [Smithellaceae bacterium]HRS89210.1 type II secretion system protein [Smithellaceae bacterium]HRV26134.1 type II secretion system protein [Smithellaceae bacterium]